MMKRLIRKTRRLTVLLAVIAATFLLLSTTAQLLAAADLVGPSPRQTETPDALLPGEEVSPAPTDEPIPDAILPETDANIAQPFAASDGPVWPTLNVPAAPAAPITPTLRPLGIITNVMTNTNCEFTDFPGDCQNITVQCSQTAQDIDVQLKVTDATTPSQRIGTIVFASGFTGDFFWDGGNSVMLGILNELRNAGYRIVQLNWMDPYTPGNIDAWFQGASGQYEGIGRLACRPATVAEWIYEEIHEGEQDSAFCAAGHSNGATQWALSVAQYGIADHFSTVLFESGPNWTRVDKLCLDPSSPLYGDSGDDFDRRLIDVSMGFGRVFSWDNSGYCITEDPNELARFQEMSITYNNWQFVYPNTSLAFVFGGMDTTLTKLHAEVFYNRVFTAGTPYVISTTVSGAGHGVASDPAGSIVIRDTLLNECVIAVAPVVTASQSSADVGLTWITDTVNLQYEVHIGATPYFTPDDGTLTGTLAGTSTTYTDTGTTGLSQRYYVVRATRGNTWADSNRIGLFRYAIEPGT